MIIVPNNVLELVAQKLADIKVNNKVTSLGLWGKVLTGITAFSSAPKEAKPYTVTSKDRTDKSVSTLFNDHAGLGKDFDLKSLTELVGFLKSPPYMKRSTTKPESPWLPTIQNYLEEKSGHPQVTDERFLQAVSEAKTYQDYYAMIAPITYTLDQYFEKAIKLAKKNHEMLGTLTTQQGVFSNIKAQLFTEIKANPSLLSLHRGLHEIAKIEGLTEDFDRMIQHDGIKEQVGTFATSIITGTYGVLRNALAVNPETTRKLLDLRDTLTTADAGSESGYGSETDSVGSASSGGGGPAAGNPEYLAQFQSGIAETNIDAAFAAHNQPIPLVRVETMKAILIKVRALGTIPEGDVHNLQSMLGHITFLPRQLQDLLAFVNEFAKPLTGMNDQQVTNVSELICAYLNATGEQASLATRLGTRLNILSDIQQGDVAKLATIYHMISDDSLINGEPSSRSDQIVDILYAIGELHGASHTAFVKMTDEISNGTASINFERNAAQPGEGVELLPESPSVRLQDFLTISKTMRGRGDKEQLKASLKRVIALLSDMKVEHIQQMHTEFQTTPAWFFELLKNDTLGLSPKQRTVVARIEQFKSISVATIEHMARSLGTLLKLSEPEHDNHGNDIPVTNEAKALRMVDSLHHMSKISDDDYGKVSEIFQPLAEEDDVQVNMEDFFGHDYPFTASQAPELLPNVRRLRSLSHLVKEEADVQKLKADIRSLFARADAAKLAVEEHLIKKPIISALGDVWRSSKKVSISKDVLLGLSIVGAIVTLAFPPAIIVVGPLILAALLALIVCFIIDLVALKKTGETLEPNIKTLAEKPSDVSTVDHTLNIITAFVKPGNAPANYAKAANELRKVNLGPVAPIAGGAAAAAVNAAARKTR